MTSLSGNVLSSKWLYIFYEICNLTIFNCNIFLRFIQGVSVPNYTASFFSVEMRQCKNFVLTENPYLHPKEFSKIYFNP